MTRISTSKSLEKYTACWKLTLLYNFKRPMCTQVVKRH